MMYWEIFLVWCGMTLNYSKLTILFSGQRYKPRLCHPLHGGWHEHWGQGQQPWLHFKEFQILASKIVFTSISYCIVGAGNMSKSNFNDTDFQWHRFSMTFNKGFDDIQFGLFKNYDLTFNFDIYGRTITTCQTLKPPLHLIEAAAMHANSGLT